MSMPLRLRLSLPLAALAAFAGLPAPAWGMVARLDDSASPRAHVNADFRQAQMVDARTVSLPFGRVEYRLATAPYIGRRARIYYVIPHAIVGLRSPAALQVLWRGSGTFASGSGRPGDRVQVWNGVVQGPWMNETFDLHLRIDPRALQLPPGSALSFESTFEIETLP